MLCGRASGSISALDFHFTAQRSSREQSSCKVKQNSQGKCPCGIGLPGGRRLPPDATLVGGCSRGGSQPRVHDVLERCPAHKRTDPID